MNFSYAVLEVGNINVLTEYEIKNLGAKKGPFHHLAYLLIMAT